MILYWCMIALLALWSGCISYWVYVTFIQGKDHGERINTLEFKVEDLEEIFKILHPKQ